MARIVIALVVVFVVVSSTFGMAVDDATTKVPETTKPPTEVEITGDEEDFAVIQNAEDDAEQYRADCSSGEEYIRHPRLCGRFYQCSNGIPYLIKCPSGLYFDLVNKVCDYPQNVDCRNKADRCSFRRIGFPSGSGDDDVSIATCPEGTVPVSCSSSDPRNSDGNYVNGRDCLAVNSARGEGQRAIAVCANVDDNDYVFETSGEWELNPVASCPFNYRIVNCFLRNAWSPIRYAFAQIRPGRDSCYADIPCTAGKGCFVQAVCRRRTYLKDPPAQS